MPSLTFQLKKRNDGSAQLTLIREDGSVTTGPVGSADGYFPIHDLTHLVIEQALGLSEGFLGLIASGWEINDFGVKGAAKLLPPEAFLAEGAAGELSRQIVMRQPSNAADFLWVLEVKSKGPLPLRDDRPLTDDLLNAMRDRIAAEWQRWKELPPKGTLELTFTAPRLATSPPPTTEQRKRGSLAAC
jgi:hypothetical protein